MLPYQKTPHAEDRIAIIGIGGAGANILHNFGGSSAENVRMYAMAMDDRLGRDFGNVEFVRLGEGETGLATGGDPDRGRSALNHSREKVQEMFSGTRVLVMVAGLGGGTASGAAPLLAEWAGQAGLYLVSILIMPFGFEGAARRRRAEEALQVIERQSNITLCFENDYMETLLDGASGAQEVFEHANRLLAQATAAVPFLTNSPGLINLGLDDLSAAVGGPRSRCLFGFGRGFGARRAEEAARTLLQSPMLAYHHSLHAVRGPVLLHVAGGEGMRLSEINSLLDAVHKELSNSGETEILFGTSVKPALQDEIRVTLITSVDAAAMPSSTTEEPEPEQETYPVPEPEPEPAPEPVEEVAPAPAYEPEPESEPVEEPAVAGEEEYPAPLREEPVQPVEQQQETEEVEELDSRVHSFFSDIDNATHEPPPAVEPPVPEPQPEAIAEQAVPEPEPQPEPVELPAEVPEPEPQPEPAPAAGEQRQDFLPLPDFAPQRQAMLDLDAAPTVHPPRRRTNAAADVEEIDSRVRDIFGDIDNAPPEPAAEKPAYSPDARRTEKDDDIDTPPSLRFNDLRDMFPE